MISDSHLSSIPALYNLNCNCKINIWDWKEFVYRVNMKMTACKSARTKRWLVAWPNPIAELQLSVLHVLQSSTPSQVESVPQLSTVPANVFILNRRGVFQYLMAHLFVTTQFELFSADRGITVLTNNFTLVLLCFGNDFGIYKKE